MTLQEMLEMKLNETRYGVQRVPGGWMYLTEGGRESGTFVPEPYDRATAQADYEQSTSRVLEQVGKQLGERLRAHDEDIAKRILAYDEHLQRVLASIGRAMPKEQVQ